MFPSSENFYDYCDYSTGESESSTKTQPKVLAEYYYNQSSSFLGRPRKERESPAKHYCCLTTLLVSLLAITALTLFLLGILAYGLLNKAYRDQDHPPAQTEAPVRLRQARSLARNKESHRTFSKEHTADGYQRRLPKAIIIGVKKGGTRALLEYLRIHPLVKAPGPEVHFFDRHYKRGLEWYRRQMPMTMPNQITVEKTPSYFVTKHCPERVAKMNSDTKIILVVRDPVTRAISDYAQNAEKRSDMLSFEDLAFTSENHPISEASPRQVNEKWGAIRLGLYWKFLSDWLEYFPLRQIHVVNGERLVMDPAAEMSSVEAFLGLPSVISPNHFYFNRTKGFPCLKDRVKLGATVRSGRPAKAFSCLGKTKGRHHPNIEPGQLRSLRSYFAPHNDIFEKLVHKKFGWLR